MKKLKEKDLELNPDVVTNLTGSNKQDGGTQPQGLSFGICPVSVAVACSMSPNQCEQTEVLVSCRENCASDFENDCDTGLPCTETLQDNCTETLACQETASGAQVCCPITVDDTCTQSNDYCPVTYACNTNDCGETVGDMCPESAQCDPTVPATNVC